MTALDLLKQMLGITDDLQDDKLQGLLDASLEYIEEYLDRKLSLADYEEYLETNCQGTIDLKNYPIIDIESIENLDGLNTYTGTDFLIIKSTGQVRCRKGLFSGDLLVKYQGGFDPLPKWAIKAQVDTAAAIYYQIEGGGSTIAMGAVKSEEIYGVAKVTYETGSSSSSSSESSDTVGPIPDSVIDVLEMYRNRYA
jgi:hypothetical protein